MTTELAAKAAYDVDQRVRATLRQMRSMWVQVAGELHSFNRSKLWQDLGHESFEHYLMELELEFELSRRWVYNSIALWEQLVVQRGVEPSRLQQLQISKVSEVLPAIRRGQVTVDDALEDAEQLRRPDLELKYRGAASDGHTAGPDTSSAIRTEREPVWKVCQCCGSRYMAQPTEE